MSRIKLTKTSQSKWLGNGFGTATASWVIKGFEHITLYKSGTAWYAYNTVTNSFIIRRADTRSEALAAIAATI